MFCSIVLTKQDQRLTRGVPGPRELVGVGTGETARSFKAAMAEWKEVR